MNIRIRLQDYINRKKAQMQRGIVVTQQMHAEKERKKLMKARYYEPGTLNYGLHHRQSVGEFMKDAYERRKQMREEKYGDKD